MEVSVFPNCGLAIILRHLKEHIPSTFPGTRNVVIKQPIGVVYVKSIYKPCKT
jgi:hypothetical protein